jgi:hypothetical protein
MGLDSYFNSVEGSVKNELFMCDEDVEHREIGYYRKFWTLHLWMFKTAVTHGYSPEDEFNDVSFRLSLKLLDYLEYDITHNKMDKSYDDWNLDEKLNDVLKSIVTAREEMKAGRDVYFISWY